MDVWIEIPSKSLEKVKYRERGFVEITIEDLILYFARKEDFSKFAKKILGISENINNNIRENEL